MNLEKLTNSKIMGSVKNHRLSNLFSSVLLFDEQLIFCLTKIILSFRLLEIRVPSVCIRGLNTSCLPTQFDIEPFFLSFEPHLLFSLTRKTLESTSMSAAIL